MDSLSYSMKTNALKDMPNDVSAKAYKRILTRFATWAKEAQHISRLDQVSDPRALTQEYADFLVLKKYSPDTIHTYIAPICKAFGINMKEIKKPIRSAVSIMRSRDDAANPIGDAEERNPKYQRLVSLASCLGIRRQEYVRLRGEDLTVDYSGHLCVQVKRGKGGKMQMQRILPDHIRTVQAVFEGVAPRQKVFSAEEMRNHIDLHAFRAEVAREAYDYYRAMIAEKGADCMIEDIKEYFWMYHKKEIGEKGNKRIDKQFRELVRDIEANDRRYIVRGVNKDRALADNRPTEYDRVALTAVSVFHLAHWRNDVTVRDYML